MTKCEQLAEKLNDPTLTRQERLRLERENLEHCQPGGDMEPNLSGGHGPVVPD